VTSRGVPERRRSGPRPEPRWSGRRDPLRLAERVEADVDRLVLAGDVELADEPLRVDLDIGMSG
jgi:hypothetical protein